MTYKQRLAEVRKADAENTKRMLVIAKAGGMTLAQLRAMPMREKDAFIERYSKELKGEHGEET